MKVLLQRVRRGAVQVDGGEIAAIGKGLVLLVGVGPGDTNEEAGWLARKCAGLRVFEDDDERMNLSVADIEGQALVVSQFTLYADADKGRRPSFVGAAQPEVAEPLVDFFADQLQQQGVPTQLGKFGAKMLVEIENDGPVTILLERDPTG